MLLGLLASGLVAAACGTSPNPASVVTVPTGSVGPTSAVTSSVPTTARQVRFEYPAGGPVDVIVPPNKDDAYHQLTSDDCQNLLNESRSWQDPDSGVAGVEGDETIYLYRSAAEVCLHQWSQAAADFSHVHGRTSFQRNQCARALVYDWVASLITAWRADPGFSPKFVTSSKTSSCAGTTSTSSSTSSTSSTSTSTSSTTTSPTSTTTSTSVPPGGG